MPRCLDWQFARLVGGLRLGDFESLIDPTFFLISGALLLPLCFWKNVDPTVIGCCPNSTLLEESAPTSSILEFILQFSWIQVLWCEFGSIGRSSFFGFIKYLCVSNEGLGWLEIFYKHNECNWLGHVQPT